MLMTLNTIFNSLQASTKRVYKQAQKKSFTTTGETMWVFYFNSMANMTQKVKLTVAPFLSLLLQFVMVFDNPF